MEDENKQKKTYPPLLVSPLKPCGSRPDAEVAPQVSRIFPAGGPEAILTDPSLPFHPSNRWLSRERCTRAGIRETHRQIVDLETRIADYQRQIDAFRDLSNEEHNTYTEIVENVPKTSTANVRTRVNAFYRFQQRTADYMVEIVRTTFNQRRLMEELEELHNTLEAQRVGWGYLRLHPQHEFVVYYPRNVPIIQRTQTGGAPAARRRLNMDSVENDQDNAIPPPKRPRDKRNTEKESCTIVPMFNITYITDLTNPDNLPGIYVFQDKTYEVKQKLDHLLDIFLIIKKTLHAWHDSWFYTSLHEKMTKAYEEFQSNVLNEDFSTHRKKVLAINYALTHITKFMDENYAWYTSPQDVPQKIINLLENAQNKL